MSRVTIIPEDSLVIVDGVSHKCDLPAAPDGIYAIQYYPDTGHATLEKKIGEPQRREGVEAFALVKPFIDSHATEAQRSRKIDDAAKASREAEAVADAQRVERQRAELAKTDTAAVTRVEAARAAEIARAQNELTSPPAGNVAASGTQAI